MCVLCTGGHLFRFAASGEAMLMLQRLDVAAVVFHAMSKLEAPDQNLLSLSFSLFLCPGAKCGRRTLSN